MDKQKKCAYCAVLLAGAVSLLLALTLVCLLVGGDKYMPLKWALPIETGLAISFGFASALCLERWRSHDRGEAESSHDVRDRRGGPPLGGVHHRSDR